MVTPHIFAQTICEDFDLPIETYQKRIAEQIEEKVRETEIAVLPSFVPTSATMLDQALSEKEMDWWERMKRDALGLDESAPDEQDRPKAPKDLVIEEADDQSMFDLRIRIQVRMTHGHFTIYKFSDVSFSWSSFLTARHYLGSHAPDRLL